MNNGRSLVAFIVLACIFVSCVKQESENRSALTLTDPKILMTGLVLSSQGLVDAYSFTYDDQSNVSIIYALSHGDKYFYMGFGYNGGNTEIVRWVDTSRGVTVTYDANKLPVSGKMRYATTTSSIGNTYIVDNLVYKTEGGRVTYVGSYLRTSYITEFNRNPTNYSVDVQDSSVIYRIYYNGNNVSKIRSEVKPGKIIEETFTWGTGKGIFSDANIIPLVCPMATLDYGYMYISQLSKNELLSYTRTYISENNRKVTLDYLYNYNESGYPISAIVTGAATTGGIYNMAFTYQ